MSDLDISSAERDRETEEDRDTEAGRDRAHPHIRGGPRGSKGLEVREA